MGALPAFMAFMSLTRIVSVIVQLCLCDCVFVCVTLKEDKCEAGRELVTGEM